MKAKNLCTISARGGSKRIPRKNIKLFKGKSIIVSSIIVAAIESGLCDEVMVSTVDSDIAKIVKSYGASFPFFKKRGKFYLLCNDRRCNDGSIKII